MESRKVHILENGGSNPSPAIPYGGGIGKLYCGREVETHSLDDLNASSLIGANPIPTDGATRRYTCKLKSGETIDGDKTNTIERQTQRTVHRNG